MYIMKIVKQTYISRKNTPVTTKVINKPGTFQGLLENKILKIFGIQTLN